MRMFFCIHVHTGVYSLIQRTSSDIFKIKWNGESELQQMTWWTVFFPRCSPRDNCTGWLGVKHQVTCFLSKYDFVVDWVLNNNSQKPTCCCQIFTGCWHECTPRSYQTNLHELQLASPSFCFTGTWTSVGVTFLLLHRHMNFSWRHLPFVSQAHELQLASPSFCFTDTLLQ